MTADDRHLRAVPDPDPEDSVRHLEMIVTNARGTFGPGSKAVAELEAKLDKAKRLAKWGRR